MDSEARVVKLWSDGSREACILLGQFQQVGYSVQTILSGSPEPIASSDTLFVAGYSEIRSAFALPAIDLPRARRAG